MNDLTNSAADDRTEESVSASMADCETSFWSAFVGRSSRFAVTSIFDQGVVSATNFATMLIIARLCSKADVGVYYLGWTIILFLMGAQGNLISIPYTMHCRRREEESSASYAGSTLVHQLCVSFFAIVCIFALSIITYFDFGPSEMLTVEWVLIIIVPIVLLREYIRRFMFAHLAVGGALLLDICVSCIQITGLLSLAFFHELSVPGVYAIVGCACVLSLLVWMLTNHHPIDFQRKRILSDWRENWHFGKWAFAGQFTGLSFYILPWLLTFAHSTAETGMFAACNTLVGLANPFVLGMCNFLTPKSAHAFSNEGVAGLNRVLRKTALVFAISLGLFFLLTFFAGNFMAVLVYGGKFHGAGPVIAVLSFALLLDALGLTANNGLWATDHPGANFPVDIAQMSVTLATALWLVFPLGALGIAVAIAVGRVAGVLLRWIVFWILINPRHAESEAAL
ncbi:MAG: lipopolysaccharide biosynthesis protein [Thermoguttaceae bacterium]